MTITVLPTRNEYTVAVPQAVFNYTFKIFEASDLSVYVTPAGQACSDSDLTTAYAVTQEGDPSGGTIILNTAASVGDLITIVSNIPESRTTDYQTNGDFLPDTVNDDFDRVVSLAKQTQTSQDRTPQFIECEQGVDNFSLPTPLAGAYLRTKSDLTGYENASVPAVIISDTNIGTVSNMQGSTTLQIGEIVTTTGYVTPGDYGANTYEIVAGGTGTADGGSFIDLAGTGFQAKALFNNGVNPYHFGVSDSASAASNTAKMQAVINYICSNDITLDHPGIKIKTGALTTPDSTTLAISGNGGGFKNNTNGKRSEIEFTGTAATESFLFTTGDHAHPVFEGVILSTSDVTEQWGFLSVDSLAGGSTNQNSADGTMIFDKVSCYDAGGTCFLLGGESFSEFTTCSFTNVAQAIAQGVTGEISMNHMAFSTLINGSFTPGAGNADYMVYIEQSAVTMGEDIVLADSGNLRTYFGLINCPNIAIRGKKFERPGNTAPTTHMFYISNTFTGTKICRNFSMTDFTGVASSATGSFAGRFVKFAGVAGAIYQGAFSSCTFSYSSGVSNTVPSIDCTDAAPRIVSLSNNFREASDNPLISFSDGYTSLANKQALLQGLCGDDISFITVQSLVNNLAISQTGTNFFFDQQFDAVFMEDNLKQILPVDISARCSATPTGVASFYLSTDSAKADKVTLDGSNAKAETRFALRSDYIRSPDQVAPTRLLVNYDSDASINVAHDYTVRLTYAIINDPLTSRFNKHLIDVV